MTVVPTKVFLERGYAKIEIALAKGKKAQDKRDTIAERDSKKRIARAIKEGRKAEE